MHTKIKKLVITALLAALTCAATMIIKIPSPLKGYVNLGDCMVLAAGWMLSPAYAFLAAGIGSALADFFAGYLVYAPATFVIKGLMALIACYGYRMLSKKIGDLASCIVSGAAAEILMVAGYYIFEGFLYGFGASVVNIPPNCMQGIAGVVIGTFLIRVLKPLKIGTDLQR